jgi:diaminopimelate decarboxylase
MFSYTQNLLQWRGQDVSSIIERATSALLQEHQYTGPFWVYQQALLSERLRMLEQGLPGAKFHFSVKSQSNLTLLSFIAAHERFGADVVSGGEL